MGRVRRFVYGGHMRRVIRVNDGWRLLPVGAWR